MADIINSNCFGTQIFIFRKYSTGHKRIRASIQRSPSMVFARPKTRERTARITVKGIPKPGRYQRGIRILRTFLKFSAIRSTSASPTACQSSSPRSLGLLVQGRALRRGSGRRRVRMPAVLNWGAKIWRRIPRAEIKPKINSRDSVERFGIL